MTVVHCASLLPYERFVDYWLDDLPQGELDQLEEHLIGCADCSRLVETWSVEMLAIAEQGRVVPRPFLTPEQLAALGTQASIVDLADRRESTVRIDAAPIQVFRVALDGKLLGELEKLDVEYIKEGYADPIFHVSGIPLPSDSNALHFACHSHVLNAHGDVTLRLVGTRAGERFTAFETLMHFVS